MEFQYATDMHHCEWNYQLLHDISQKQNEELLLGRTDPWIGHSQSTLVSCLGVQDGRWSRLKVFTNGLNDEVYVFGRSLGTHRQ